MSKPAMKVEGCEVFYFQWPRPSLWGVYVQAAGVDGAVHLHALGAALMPAPPRRGAGQDPTPSVLPDRRRTRMVPLMLPDSQRTRMVPLMLALIL